MTIDHSTLEQGTTVHPAQTLEGAKRAAAILQLPEVPVVAEDDGGTVYLDTGAGLVFGISTAGSFSMHALERGGRPSVVLTTAETQALQRFWLPICAQAVLEHITAGIAHVKATRAQEDTHGSV